MIQYTTKPRRPRKLTSESNIGVVMYSGGFSWYALELETESVEHRPAARQKLIRLRHIEEGRSGLGKPSGS
jgi:hypothetical protein